MSSQGRTPYIKNKNFLKNVVCLRIWIYYANKLFLFPRALWKMTKTNCVLQFCCSAEIYENNGQNVSHLTQHPHTAYGSCRLYSVFRNTIISSWIASYPLSQLLCPFSLHFDVSNITISLYGLAQSIAFLRVRHYICWALRLSCIRKYTRLLCFACFINLRNFSHILARY